MHSNKLRHKRAARTVTLARTVEEGTDHVFAIGARFLLPPPLGPVFRLLLLRFPHLQHRHEGSLGDA